MSELSNINNKYESYQKLIDFYQEHKNKIFDEVQLSLTQWFSANMCAALGCILDDFSDKLNDIKFDNLDPAIEKILLKNDFLSYYGYSRLNDHHHTTIPFLKLKITDGKFFNNYVMTELIGRDELPKMSPSLKEKMAEAIYEIFVNAQIHSNSSHIYTCGQYFLKDNRIEFTIVDLGIGFKRKINERFNSELTATQAIKWATKNRHTTKIGITGGIGLALLNEFVAINKGKVQIISEDGFYECGPNGESEKLFIGGFPGTIVNLQFKTNDNNSYALKGEIDNNDIF